MNLHLLISAFIINTIHITLIVKNKKNLGVDRFYFDVVRNEYEKNKLFPFKINKYLLELKHTYPPLWYFFNIFSSRTKIGRFLFSYSNIFIDLIRIIFLSIIIYILFKDINILILAISIFYLVPCRITYGMQPIIHMRFYGRY